MIKRPSWLYALGQRNIKGTVVVKEQFNADLRELEIAIIKTCADHFRARGRSFCHETLLACTTIDVTAFMREIYFYGAEIIPFDIPMTPAQRGEIAVESTSLLIEPSATEMHS